MRCRYGAQAAVVDTAFLDASAALIAEDKFEAFLVKSLEHLDLVFEKSTDKGKRRVAFNEFSEPSKL